MLDERQSQAVTSFWKRTDVGERKKEGRRERNKHGKRSPASLCLVYVIKTATERRRPERGVCREVQNSGQRKKRTGRRRKEPREKREGQYCVDSRGIYPEAPTREFVQMARLL